MTSIRCGFVDVTKFDHDEWMNGFNLNSKRRNLVDVFAVMQVLVHNRNYEDVLPL